MDDLLNTVVGFDIVGTKVSLHHNYLLVFVIYIPSTPTAIELETITDYFLEHFSQATNILIVGDFNINKYCNNNIYDPVTVAFKNFCNILDLQQYNTIYNRDNKILDLTISNLNCIVQRENSPFVDEDTIYHPSLSITASTTHKIKRVNFKTCSSKQYNFRKADYNKLYEAIALTDWSYLDTCTEVNDCCHKFYTKLYSLFDKFVPLQKNNTKRHLYPKWYTTQIINNIRQKHKFHRLYKRTQKQQDLDKFKHLRSLIKIQTQKAYKDFVTKTESNIHDDPAQFWNFINSKKGITRIPGKITFDDITYNTPTEIVNAFKNYFNTVFQKSTSYKNNVSIFNNHPLISVNTVSEDDVVSAVKKLKNKQTTGPDLVPSFLLKDCVSILAKPILKIINLSLTSSTFPETWKSTKICPVHKKGSTSMVTNYRPIAIISNVAKIFETILHKHIYRQVKHLISPDQHGFVENRSTTTNLCCFSQFATEILDQRGQVDVIYTDFSKAFDRVDHGILLTKLHSAGFSIPLLSLIKSYLTERNLFVSYSGYKSTSFNPTSGVPQGSNLGPLLFLLFINDITDTIDSNVLIYADDIKIYLPIYQIQDSVILQQNLNNIYEWSLINRLDLNISKCKVVTFTKKKNKCCNF